MRRSSAPVSHTTANAGNTSESCSQHLICNLLYLYAGLREYAVIAALHDSRFSPIVASELAQLRCDISLLTRFEHVTGATAIANGTLSRAVVPLHDWIIGRHGITIEFACPVREREELSTRARIPARALTNMLLLCAHQVSSRRYNATFLPQVAHEQGWTHAQTLQELIHKSGFRGPVDAALHQRIALTRYQSDCASLTWREYCQLREQLTGSPPPLLKHLPAAAAAATANGQRATRVTSDNEDEAEEEEEDEDD